MLWLTLGQLDGIDWPPWAWPPPNAPGTQPSWQEGSPALGGLGKDLCLWWDLGAPSVFSESGTPAPSRDPLRVSVGVMETAHLLKTRSLSGWKADRGLPTAEPHGPGSLGRRPTSVHLLLSLRISGPLVARDVRWEQGASAAEWGGNELTPGA